MSTNRRTAILILILGALPAPSLNSVAHARQPAHRSAQADAAEVERFFMEGIGHFNRRELEPFLTQFDADIQMYAVNEWLRGRGALRQRFESTFRDFPKVRMDITNLRARSVAPDTVTVDFEFHTYPQGTRAGWHGVGSGVYVKTRQGWREVLEHETVVRRDKSS